jgi:hypothetical protein
MWHFIEMDDPYFVMPELPREGWCIGRGYFARSPGSGVWVWFGDLPEATAEALWEQHKSRLAFPAGLPPTEAPAEEEAER